MPERRIGLPQALASGAEIEQHGMDVVAQINVGGLQVEVQQRLPMDFA